MSGEARGRGRGAAGAGGDPGGKIVAVFSGGGTGGHLYPALALAEALAGLRPDVAPFFIGALRGLEARVLPRLGVEHALLPVRGFSRSARLENLSVLGSLLRSLALVRSLFRRLRPGIVVVTGGYAGGPAGLMAGLMGIPLALQEQNAHPGLTTRVLSRWSRQIHLAFPEARDHLPEPARPRARVTGNPIRIPPDMEPGEAGSRLGFDPEDRIVLVVGGSQGAAALNEAVLECVRGVEDGALELPPGVVLFWAAGPRKLQDVEERLQEAGAPPWVRVVGYIEDMPLALRAAEVAVSRAGAMATSELLAWGVPALLVPLPTAAADHQSRNAESLEEAGAALHLPQQGLTGRRLWEALTGLLLDPDRLSSMRAAALDRGRPHATREIAGELARLISSPGGAP